MCTDIVFVSCTGETCRYALGVVRLLTVEIHGNNLYNLQSTMLKAMEYVTSCMVAKHTDVVLKACNQG